MFSFQPKDINLNICQFYYVMQQQNWYKCPAFSLNIVIAEMPI